MSFSAGCFFTDDIQNQTSAVIQGDADPSSDTELPGVSSNPASTALLGAAAAGNGPASQAETSAQLTVDPLHSEQGEATAASASNEKENLEMNKSPGNTNPSAELQWINIDLKEAQKHPVLSVSSFADTSSLSSLGTFSVGAEDQYGADEHPLWAWVSGGGCLVDLHSPLKWFTAPSGTGSHYSTPQFQLHLNMLFKKNVGLFVLSKTMVQNLG